MYYILISSNCQNCDLCDLNKAFEIILISKWLNDNDFFL